MGQHSPLFPPLKRFLRHRAGGSTSVLSHGVCVTSKWLVSEMILRGARPQSSRVGAASWGRAAAPPAAPHAGFLRSGGCLSALPALGPAPALLGGGSAQV